MELLEALSKAKNKLIVTPGDYVCVTKIQGINNDKIKPGVISVGQIEEEIRVGSEINLSSKFGISTSRITAVVVQSIHSMLVTTENSVYLIEKL